MVGRTGDASPVSPAVVTPLYSVLFCDCTRRYGVPAPFSRRCEIQLKACGLTALVLVLDMRTSTFLFPKKVLIVFVLSSITLCYMWYLELRILMSDF